jgi:surface polysaccharide O-acyltransferase-like enzyme
MMAASPDTRLAGLDAVKAVAISLVVLIHAAPPRPAWYQEHVIEGAARLGVPAFLLVTGFLAGSRSWSRRRLLLGCGRFLRLHVLWSLFYWGVSVLRDGPPERLTWKSALLHFGEGSWAGQFYFVVVVQIFLLAALLPEAAWRQPVVVAASAAAALAGMALLGAGTSLGAELGLGEWAARPLTAGSAVWHWFYYFSLGAWLGETARDPVRRLPSLPGWGTAALIGAGVLIAAAAWPGSATAPAPGLAPYARLPILLGATLVGLALPSLASRAAPRALLRLGAETFGVFVLNPAILSLWNGLAGAATSLPGSWLRAAATVAVAAPVASLLRRRAGWLLP